jgi:hypothetical protein
MQRIQLAIGDPVDAETIQEILSSLAQPGVLLGFDLTVPGSGTLAVQPGAALTDSGVLIVEDEAITIPFSPTLSAGNFTLYYSYIPSNNFGGNPAVLVLQPGLFPADNFINGVVLGWLKYPGGSVQVNPETMYIPAPRIRLSISPLKRKNEFQTLYSPLSTRWTQYQLVGGPASKTATTTTGSNTIIVSSNAGISVGQLVTGDGIPLDTLVTAISGTTITLSEDATATAAGVSVSFTIVPKVIESYDSTTKVPVTAVYNPDPNIAIQVGYIVPFRVPLDGLGQVELYLQTDYGATAAIFLADSLGNVLSPSTFNIFTNNPMSRQVLNVPQNDYLTPNSEMFVQLVLNIPANSYIRFRSVGISSYTDPF